MSRPKQHDANFWALVLRVRRLVKTRHDDADQRIANAIGMGSAKTLRVGLSRFRTSLSALDRPAWDALEENLDANRTLVLGPEWFNATEAEISKHLDQLIAQALLGLGRMSRLQNPKLRTQYVAADSAADVAAALRAFEPK